MEHHTSLPLAEQRPREPDGAWLGELAREGPLRGSRDPVSLYLHVPFCFHKCHYCDFYSLVDRRDRQAAFVERLERELEALVALAPGGVSPPPLRTIFAGGGTPTLLRPDLWERLLGTIRRVFDVPEGAEFTVECNPETAGRDLFEVLAGGGVNRISIGAQSFDVRHLRTLERHHDPDRVARALDLAAESGIPRASLDLIYAIPGQTLAEWERDLGTALSLGVAHLSCYALTYEAGTAMSARLVRGEFEPCKEDLEADMYLLTVERCRERGLERYEVSNFARPGQRCAHNLVYWRQGDWLAAGPSASGHVRGNRWRNVPRLDAWLGSGGPYCPVVDAERAEAGRNLAERIMTGIRLGEGLEARGILDAGAALGAEVAERLEDAAGRLRARGLLSAHGGRWRLTDAGFLFADGAARELMSALGPCASGG